MKAEKKFYFRKKEGNVSSRKKFVKAFSSVLQYLLEVGNVSSRNWEFFSPKVRKVIRKYEKLVAGTEKEGKLQPNENDFHKCWQYFFQKLGKLFLEQLLLEIWWRVWKSWLQKHGRFLPCSILKKSILEAAEASSRSRYIETVHKCGLLLRFRWRWRWRERMRLEY